MISRDEFNKVLKLIDAGIITPFDNIQHIIDFSEPIKGSEEFIIDFKIGTADNPSVLGSTNKLNNLLTNTINFIDEFNQKEDLKLSKVKHRLYWELEFYGISINIEDIYVDSFDMDSDNVKKIEGINSYLQRLFKNIKLSLIDPETIINGFPTNIPNLKYLKNIDSLNYTDVIIKSSVSGNIKLVLSYYILIKYETIGE